MINVYFLILPKVHLFDLASPVQVLHEANHLGGTKFGIQFVGSSRTVGSAQGLTFSNLRCVDEVAAQREDIVCVPGIDFQAFAAGDLNDEIEQLSAFVRNAWQDGSTVMSICTGSLVLAQMGLLNNKKCSTHWKCFDFVRQRYPRVILEEKKLYSYDQNIYTSAGMTAGIDMMLAYLEKRWNPLMAASISQEMVINIRREDIGDQRNIFLNFKNKFHPLVYQIQQILENRVHEIVTLDQLSKELNMSSRNLNRLFRKHTGRTIATYRTETKLKEAQKLLLHSEKSIKEIAHHLGFATEPYFIRAWKKKFGMSPGQFRKERLIKSPGLSHAA